MAYIGNTYRGEDGIFTAVYYKRSGEWFAGVWDRQTGKRRYSAATYSAYSAASWAHNLAKSAAGGEESTILMPAGYIVRDREGYAISGTGATEAEARADAIKNADPFEDREGNTVGHDDPDFGFDAKFVIVPATAALLRDVAENGGAIAWSEIDGVACSRTEAGE